MNEILQFISEMSAFINNSHRARSGPGFLNNYLGVINDFFRFMNEIPAFLFNLSLAE